MITPENIPALVAECYARDCAGDRERMLETALHDLWRNFPEWPSTFGPCHNPVCDRSGRGGGLCAGCVTACIGEIVGAQDPADAMRRAIQEVRAARRELRNLVSPKSTL